MTAPADVEAFLRANPAFLAARPALCRQLLPPARAHGEELAAMLAAGRASAALSGRVQRAVLALMRAPDPPECVALELPALLGVDAALLCAEDGWRPFLHRLPPGSVARLLGARPVLLRDAPPDARTVHAEAAPLARHDALVRVPRRDRPLLLALASREAAPLRPAAALRFLGEALAAALDRAPARA